MIRTLLIANRGEIACRIVRTCRRLGIRTVAVFSDADRGALHVRAADVAVRIGPADAARSYLDADAILDAARRTGADAIHPGYGFLSERTVLPLRCAELGLVWVGPSADAIERMGSKIEAKRIAASAGVLSVPGAESAGQDDAALAAAAAAIGFPVLVKASAGGGGRGMRLVERASDLPTALASARQEALLGFGNGALLIEKLIARPRHIEVQLAGDRHGNLVHLFERECSIQRSYQKLVEEAPAPNLTARTRDRLFEAALTLGRAIGYDSLGTAEFILEEDGEQPYFLEMNTRLQVEHPVTEEVTGLDLVEWQIRIAEGHELPLRQDEIRLRGAAIEIRVNAEAPGAGFRPEVGTIAALAAPAGQGLRFETGVADGSEVTPFYDSMIAKLIAHGEDRADAVRRLQTGLQDLAVFGVGTNQRFLQDVVAHPAFIEGRLTTRFLDEAFPGGWQPDGAPAAEDWMAAACAWMLAAADAVADFGPWTSMGGFRVLAPAGRPGRVTLDASANDENRTIVVEGMAGQYRVRTAGADCMVEASRDGPTLVVAVDGVTRNYRAWTGAGRVALAASRQDWSFAVAPLVARLSGKTRDAGAGSPLVKAAMPGRISAIEVTEGQIVAQGDTVVVMEAMKLLLRLPAPMAGRVAEVLCQVDQVVAAGAVLLRLEPE